ncbi:hypothetical protein GH714_001281 [Hevea brasiliensis]|uniref:Uncharacterized protein n=1 Tax=Hevea brasiliensis TaxID=3981 RepID=A0A6A6M6E8_HEVBR|nr:hypothetical protein GH714_001281 [Hevea brasiliensis]
METLLEIPDYPDAEALFAFTDGLQTWARMEIERRGAHDLAIAISIVNPSWSSRGAKGADPVQRRIGAREVTAKARMEAPNPTSRRRDTPRVRGKTEVCNALLFRAFFVMDRIKLENAQRKASSRHWSRKGRRDLSNPGRRPWDPCTRDTKVRIGDWHGTLDFFIVSMDDSPCILGVEFVDRAKAIPMLFANSMCITEGGGTCVVPLLRGKASNTLATMHVEMHDPSSAAQGEKQHGKGGGTPKKDPKECKRGHTPKLQKGQPPREKVDCARGNAVARSPKEESPPRQEGPRRHRSRKSRRKCKAEGRASALSHRDEGGTAGAQLEQARSNREGHAGRHGRRSKRRWRHQIEWGRMSPHKSSLPKKSNFFPRGCLPREVQ